MERGRKGDFLPFFISICSEIIPNVLNYSFCSRQMQLPVKVSKLFSQKLHFLATIMLNLIVFNFSFIIQDHFIDLNTKKTDI
jgi:hypothetical protein